MFEAWLKEALVSAKMSQADLARQLTAALGRSIDKNAIGKILAGSRKLYADELIEIAKICEVSIPSQTPRRRPVSTISLYRFLLHGIINNAPWITDTEGVKAVTNVMIESIVQFLEDNDVSFDDDMSPPEDIMSDQAKRLMDKPGAS